MGRNSNDSVECRIRNRDDILMSNYRQLKLCSFADEAVNRKNGENEHHCGQIENRGL